MTVPITLIEKLQRQAASLLIYQSVLNNSVGQAFLKLLQAIKHSDHDGINCLYAYGDWFKALTDCQQSWQDYLVTQIVEDNNAFSQQVQLVGLKNVPPALITAAQQDLQALHSLYQCSSEQLSNWVQITCQLPVAPTCWNVEAESAAETQLFVEKLQQEKWTDALKVLAIYYQQFGTGLFAQHRALRWQSGQLLGINHPDLIEINQLTGYEFQKETLLKNTEFLLAGYSALHVLLYGSRGTGKSSLVKGLLNQYSQRGLRLIEVSKSDLKDLAIIVERLRDVPQKFIIFVDDLSFEEDDDAFKALKVVLEGSVTARSQNVVVYATSNRRHLIREFFEDRPRPREGEEVHAWDTVQEKLSFSDRFGLTLTFEPANQDTYLKIVRHLALQAKIALTEEDLDYRALQWATRHNGRSGRTARQFIDFLQADLVVSGAKETTLNT
jgi:predicted AAA+ superfamily ATPase